MRRGANLGMDFAPEMWYKGEEGALASGGAFGGRKTGTEISGDSGEEGIWRKGVYSTFSGIPRRTGRGSAPPCF